MKKEHSLKLNIDEIQGLIGIRLTVFRKIVKRSHVKTSVSEDSVEDRAVPDRHHRLEVPLGIVSLFVIS